MPDLSGQVAIISGGLGDIGRATADELARHGAAVAISDVRPAEDAATFLSDLRGQGRRCRYDAVDVADANEVSDWLATVERELGAATLVIVNAATVTLAGIRDVTPEQWSREIQVNLTGAFHMAQAAVMRMLHHQKAGRIVFVGSWAAHAPHPNIVTYCVAKAGLRMLCKCMAIDLAVHGILVNEIAPGYVDAGLSGNIWKKTPGARERAAERVPTGKLITAEEVAVQIAHLCDPENRHMTGSVALMDGGLSLVTPAAPQKKS